MRTASQCTDMAQVRDDVNAIDREIVRLLGRRLEYVRCAVRFKPDEESIRRPDHWERFFAQRRAWAEQEGYDPEVIEAIYQRLYEYTVHVQLDLYRQRKA